MEQYKNFLKHLDEELKTYFSFHKDYIFCTKGCSNCCKKGDYPISTVEFNYLMKGYIALSDSNKQKIKKQILNIKEGGSCPFLLDDECSLYDYRPIICRVHGLSYQSEKCVLLPYCANDNKNYSKVYNNGELYIEPIKQNLDTPQVLKQFDYGIIKPMYNWFL